MAIEKINFSYPKGSLQGVFDGETLTALELASKTSKKVDECVELVNGVEQSAIEATAVVDEMRITQEQFITENNDIRQSILTENGEFIDDMNTAKTSFVSSLTTMTGSANTQFFSFIDSMESSKNNFEETINNEIESITNNSTQQITNDVNNKIDAMKNDGTLNSIINDELFTEINDKINANEVSVTSFPPLKSNIWIETIETTKALLKNKVGNTWNNLYPVTLIDNILDDDGITKFRNKIQKKYIGNVKDYGAKGDGINDDTSAFNLAIANNTSILIPDGIFKITPLLINKRINIIGNGGSSIIKPAYGTAFTISYDGGSTPNQVYRDFNIELTTDTNGIDCQSGEGILFQNVNIYCKTPIEASGNIGIKMGGQCMIKNCMFQYLSKGIYSNRQNNWLSDNFIVGCLIGFHVINEANYLNNNLFLICKKGISTEGNGAQAIQYTYINNCIFDSNIDNDIYFTGHAKNNGISNCWFSSLTGVDTVHLYFGGTDNGDITITNCHFDNNPNGKAISGNVGSILLSNSFINAQGHGGIECNGVRWIISNCQMRNNGIFDIQNGLTELRLNTLIFYPEAKVNTTDYTVVNTPQLTDIAIPAFSSVSGAVLRNTKPFPIIVTAVFTSIVGGSVMIGYGKTSAPNQYQINVPPSPNGFPINLTVLPNHYFAFTSMGDVVPVFVSGSPASI